MCASDEVRDGSRGTSNRATVAGSSPRAPRNRRRDEPATCPGGDLHQVLTVRGDLVVHIQDPRPRSAMREAGIEEQQAPEREPVPRAARGSARRFRRCPCGTPRPPSPSTATGSASRCSTTTAASPSCSGRSGPPSVGGGRPELAGARLARPPGPLGRRVVHRRHRELPRRVAVDELYEELRQSGVLHPASSGGVSETDFGTREFATLDLDGNLVTFFREWESES